MKGDGLQRVVATLTSRRAKQIYVFVTVAAAVVGVLALSWTLAGPIATILYAFLFMVGLAGIPTAVALGSKSFSGGLKRVFGNLHVVLGQLALGHGYLVQKDGAWHICMGDAESVHIDGRRYPIESGTQNRSILGWQPFGVLLFKDDETLQDKRIDAAAEAGAALSDGDNTATVERAGFEQVPKPATPNGLDERWVIDLKRVFTRGVAQIADIAAIEKAEEIAMREQAASSRTAGWEAIIGAIVGLLLGLLTGYIMLVPT